MNKRISLALAMGLIAVAGCSKNDQSGQASNGTEAVKKAGDKTIAASLDQNSQFVTLAKAAGLDVDMETAANFHLVNPYDYGFDAFCLSTPSCRYFASFSGSSFRNSFF
jgi:hypothetical protein